MEFETQEFMKKESAFAALRLCVEFPSHRSGSFLNF